MSTRRSLPIVVGVDGSGSSFDAVIWAARAAELRDATLKLVSAYRFDSSRDSADSSRSSAGASAPGSGFEEYAAAEAILAAALTVAERAVERPDELTAVVESIAGSAIEAMLDQSAHASMMVVGSRGNGEYFAELLGSVSTAVAEHARCPVAIVPGLPDRGRASGPIVVGVDGSASNQRAVESAFEEAARRGIELVAVHVSADGSTSSPDSSEADRNAGALSEGRSVLAESLSGWSKRYPGVQVQSIVLCGNVVDKTLEVARSACAVVIGSSGRGGPSGRLLGSTARSLIHRVDCPLIIARG